MTAKQALFVVPDDNDPHMGILIDHDYVICAECGGVFEADEVFIIQTHRSDKGSQGSPSGKSKN